MDEQTTAPDSPPWWRSHPDAVEAYLRTASAGDVSKLATSNGGRPVFLYEHGDREDTVMGTANFNSAVAAGDLTAYADRAARSRPVLLYIAGTHGQEMEGTVAALSLVNVIETGKDLAGRPHLQLQRRLAELRVLIVAQANPDGRARLDHEGWVGRRKADMQAAGQGTSSDGTVLPYPGGKAVHPRTQDVGPVLGAYYDDHGVNLMHDEWFDPMSPVTTALLALVRREAPDLAINVHSHPGPPFFLPVAYLPLTAQLEAAAFERTVHRGWSEADVPFAQMPLVHVEGAPGSRERSFNLASATYHAGAARSLIFEGPDGVSDVEHPFTYEQILDSHRLVAEAAAEWLQEPSWEAAVEYGQ